MHSSIEQGTAVQRPSPPERVGLMAGWGRFPLVVAEAAVEEIFDEGGDALLAAPSLARKLELVRGLHGLATLAVEPEQSARQEANGGVLVP